MLLPYNIVFDEENVAHFTADNGAKYKALFSGLPMPGVPELEGFIFDFSFQRDTSECKNPKHPGYDGRIRATLEKLMNEFFEQAPYNIMSFVCDDVDAKHKTRQRIFADWHEPHKAVFAKNTFVLPSGALDEAGNMGETVGGVFYRKDSPLAAVIESSFTAEIAYYSMIKADY